MTCKAPASLTAEELAALELARKQGGRLHRHDAGWGPEEFDLDNLDSLFGNATVKGLVSRNLMRWATYERTPTGRMPVEVEVVG